MPLDINFDEFKKKYPYLANEMKEKKMHVKIDAVRPEPTDDSIETLSGYVPNAIDFLRRCNTNEDAKEIINFLETRSEISPEYANKLRLQLQQKGVRSFGSKKIEDYYSKKFKRDKVKQI